MKNWRKIIIVGALILALILTMVACNMDLIDTTYHFDRAIIYLPNGEVIEGKVQSWTDYENSDQIQVKINGKTYLTHITNVVLIDE